MDYIPGVVPLYSAAEMRTVDRVTVDEIGVPGAVLMEHAGIGAAAEIMRWFPDTSSVAVVCGAGNNGGDGFVVARLLLLQGIHVSVLMVEPPSKTRRESRVNMEICRKLGISVERVNATQWKSILNGYDLVVDAMLGTGVTGAPRPNIEVAIRAIADSRLPVVSLDVPTGVDASTGAVESAAVNADLTVTFHRPKIGLAVAPGRFYAGRVKAVDIGIPRVVEEPVHQGIATPDIIQLVPPRDRAGNKYDSGTVCCVGGSVGMAGAIRLTATAAMRSGAGVVWGIVPDPIAGPLDIEVPEVQFRGAIADEAGRLTVAAAERIESVAGRADVVVFGPGVGTSDQVKALARWILRNAPMLVIDAEGISAFAGDTNALAARDGAPTLLTPHEGELAQLLNLDKAWVKQNRLQAARDAAAKTRCTVLLKGEDTLVVLPSGDFLVARSDAAAATAGSGDVLAGACAALLARGLDTLMAGACAATACGVAASTAATEFAQAGVVASDILRYLPGALDGQCACFGESAGNEKSDRS